MAKYHRLSEEQLHTLHFEFAQFLATQGIDKNEWDALKKQNTSQIGFLLDAFSDAVFEKLFDQAAFLEFITPNKAFLFHTQKEVVSAIVIQNELSTIDLTKNDAWSWLATHWENPKITFFKSEKKYPDKRNAFLYDYFKKGAVITNGDRYRQWKSIL